MPGALWAGLVCVLEIYLEVVEGSDWWLILVLGAWGWKRKHQSIPAASGEKGEAADVCLLPAQLSTQQSTSRESCWDVSANSPRVQREARRREAGDAQWEIIQPQKRSITTTSQKMCVWLDSTPARPGQTLFLHFIPSLSNIQRKGIFPVCGAKQVLEVSLHPSY